MIIPSIDLMDGKAVQLRQGKEHVLTAEESPIALAERFNRYGQVAVIDLDAALKHGDSQDDNLDLIRQLCRVAEVRAGGGVRDPKRAEELLRAGAERIIVGTAATPEFLSQFPPERVMVAIDHHDGEVVDKGWTHSTGEHFLDRAKRLSPHCSSFLCTFVKHEGGMGGMNIAEAIAIQAQLPEHPITFAGGVATTQEVIDLSRQGLDIQVGMALYTGKLNLAEAVVGSLDFAKFADKLIPTIVQDPAGQILMLAYSSAESLQQALNEAQGIYYSRSRQSLWHKGKTSGHTQRLISCRPDCDRDALLFTVEQTGPACHTQAYSCFSSGLKTQKPSLEKLFNVLLSRKHAIKTGTAPEKSYTAKLFQNRELLLKKIMEEAFEATQAQTFRDRVWEIADVIFFLSVLAVDEDIAWHDLEAELEGRTAIRRAP